MSTAARHARTFSVLDRGECLALVDRHDVGRLAYTLHDRVDIQPVHSVATTSCPPATSTDARARAASSTRSPATGGSPSRWTRCADGGRSPACDGARHRRRRARTSLIQSERRIIQTSEAMMPDV